MRSFDSSAGRTFCAVLASLIWAALALGQGPGGATASPSAEPDRKLTELWSNFLHYILIARPEAAESYGKAIIDANPDPRHVYTLAMRTDKSGATLAAGRGMKRLAPTVDRISELITKGARLVRMDPAEIARWIKMLAGTPREFLIGAERLTHSGEYAVPQLIAKLEDPHTTTELRERIATILPRLGKDAVRPLCEALNSKDPYVREVTARTLGRIGYWHAAPYLKELTLRKDILKRTRRVAEGALIMCARRSALTKPVAELFYELAEKYYRRHESLIPDSRYDTANVWYWQDGLGVTYKVAPRAIFNEIYCMRAARRALIHDEKFHPAIPLWIAANLRKEDNLRKENERRKSAGKSELKDPTHPADEPGAAFYALASSPKYLQAALARGLKDNDLAVCIGTISALATTSGTANLVASFDELGGAQPLVAALGSPARLVRYMAAETLALARPQKRFTGWHLVVPVLVEALRQTGAPTAVLVDPDLDRRNKVKDLLRAAGCAVFDDANFGTALRAAHQAGGLDLVVVSSEVSAPSYKAAVALLRSEAVFRRLPVVVLARPAETMAAKALAKSDPLVTVLRADKVDANAVAELVKKMHADAAGPTPLTPEQGAEWAIRAANALRVLAQTKNPVYDLTVATKSLIAALKDKRDPVRIAAAGALAQFRQAEAQRAIAELADDADAPEEIRLAAYASLSESIRLSGNQLTEKQINAIIEMVTAKGSLKLREGAAQALGALNLPSEKIKDLILSAK